MNNQEQDNKENNENINNLENKENINTKEKKKKNSFQDWTQNLRNSWKKIKKQPWIIRIFSIIWLILRWIWKCITFVVCEIIFDLF